MRFWQPQTPRFESRIGWSPEKLPSLIYRELTRPDVTASPGAQVVRALPGAYGRRDRGSMTFSPLHLGGMSVVKENCWFLNWFAMRGTKLNRFHFFVSVCSLYSCRSLSPGMNNSQAKYFGHLAKLFGKRFLAYGFVQSSRVKRGKGCGTN